MFCGAGPRPAPGASPGSSVMKNAQNKTDIAVLTAKSEEYEQVFRRLQDPVKWEGTKKVPNQYAWTIGAISVGSGKLIVALGLTHEQSNVPSAIAALATFSIFQPRYLIFLGIGGSLSDKVRKGDVVIADYIRAYEYGSVSDAGVFEPRSQFQEPTDQSLRTNAAAFDATNQWQRRAGKKPDGSGYSKLHFGGLASGEKVIENATAGFFAAVLKQDPRLRVVEMEAAGQALAVRNLREKGHAAGLMIVRGISDAPLGDDSRGAGKTTVAAAPSNRDTRKEWTQYASKAAAVFLEQFIRHGFPYAPSAGAGSRVQPAARPKKHLDPGVFANYQSHFVRADDLALIHSINNETYEATALVPAALLEAWWRVNPYILRLVQASDGRAVGYWNLIPLTKEAYQGLVQERLKERDIRPEDVVPYRSLQPGSVYLYIGAVSLPEKLKRETAVVILDLIVFLQLVHKKLGIDGIGAQLVSEDALNLTVNFEMTRIFERDKVSMWVLESKQQIERALKKGKRQLEQLRGLVPDWSSDKR